MTLSEIITVVADRTGAPRDRIEQHAVALGLMVPGIDYGPGATVLCSAETHEVPVECSHSCESGACSECFGNEFNRHGAG